MEFKVCNKCEKTKPLSLYVKDDRNQDGFQGICNDCRRDYKKAARQKRLAGIGIISIKEKRCNKCEIVKPADEFFRDAGIADGRSTICKGCKQKSQDLWRENNRERYNAKMRAYNKRHYQRLRIQRYALLPADYQKLHDQQKGLCAICEKPPGGSRPLAIDHCHESKVVRGLLCYGCNRALNILDNPKLLKAALAYIERSKDS